MLAVAVKKPVTKISFPHHDFAAIADLSSADIEAVLDLADHYVVQNRRKSQTTGLLKGMMAVNLFLENSTRTRLSFEIAAKRLGADVVNMTAEGSQVVSGDSFTDTLKAINAMLPDMVIIRHAEANAAKTAAELIDCPVISGGDLGEHPTQALLDALTLRRRFGHLEGLKVAIVGDITRNRVAASNILLLEKMGATVSCTGPQEFLPPGATPDMAAALTDADAVMVLRVQRDCAGTDYFKNWGLTSEKLKHAKDGAVVMHPGPLNRGVEIDAALADDPDRSLITAQVEMGVAVRMACLDLLTRSRR